MRALFTVLLPLGAAAACSGGDDGGTTPSTTSSSSSSSGSTNSSSSSSSGSASSSSGSTGACDEMLAAATAPALSAYCTVQSAVSLAVLRASPPLGWASEGHPCVPAGATVYLASNGKGGVEGYVFLDGGVPGQLQAGLFDTTLVAGTHYTGTCPAPATEPPKVLLTDVNVYATKDLSGTACKMTAGTELPDFAFSNVDVGVVSVSSSAVQTACGYQLGYSKDVTVAALVKK